MEDDDDDFYGGGGLAAQYGEPTMKMEEDEREEKPDIGEEGYDEEESDDVRIIFEQKDRYMC